jgi:hypothetical protein
MPDFNPNSIDACLARIEATQDAVKSELVAHRKELAEQLTSHHTEIIKRIEESEKAIRGLEAWKYKAVGAVSAVVIGLEHGYRWLAGGNGKH